MLKPLLPSHERTMSRRSAVVEALSAIGSPARMAVPALLEWFKSANADADSIGNVLSQLIRPDDGPALMAVMALLDHPQARESALRLLLQLRPQGLAPHPALVRLLHDPNKNIQRYAFVVLGRLGASARPAVPHVLEVAQSSDFSIRYRAIRTLGEIGERATAAIPALLEWSHDTDAFIRLASAESLQKIDPMTAAKGDITNTTTATPRSQS